jgi:hypothetical protein
MLLAYYGKKIVGYCKSNLSFTIPSSLETWLCEKHLRSFRSYFTHPVKIYSFIVSLEGWYLSMAPEDSFTRRLTLLDTAFLHHLHLFGTEQGPFNHKTLGMLLV